MKTAQSEVQCSSGNDRRSGQGLQLTCGRLLFETVGDTHSPAEKSLDEPAGHCYKDHHHH